MSPYLNRPLRTIEQVLAERDERAAKGPLSPPYNEWFEREHSAEWHRKQRKEAKRLRRVGYP